MSHPSFSPRRFVTGPDGAPISLSDLPPPDTQRWVVRRKAIVVCAVRGGLLTVEEACERYRLSMDEFMSWQRMSATHGMEGLRVTKIQKYRQVSSARAAILQLAVCVPVQASRPHRSYSWPIVEIRTNSPGSF